MDLIENHNADDETLFDYVIKSVTAARGTMRELEKLDSSMAKAEETAQMTVSKVQQRAKQEAEKAIQVRARLQGECVHLEDPCVFCGFSAEE